ncbi:galactoside alpha-(1,2)-fucosyltransferase 2-like [Ylistrum balloti]|uniref:galactoside alpha-(1,2)-fucosyltransferase 2-like n=1 Tax=Ylistrum balloti TaxID=509963 RepID=UPI002905AFB1|nr:galactoside alpha-(1,2)-fucosyltransferase 2-like [Ylistrum balloti]
MDNPSALVIGTMRITYNVGFKPKVFLVVLVVLVLVTISRWKSCINLYLEDRNHLERTHFVCMPLQGRLANQMFQYAFIYAFSKEKELVMTLLETETENILLPTFNMRANPFPKFKYCSCLSRYEDDWDCAYDIKFEKMEKRQDVFLHGYFQSWKYWKCYENEIREKFQFQKHVRTTAAVILQSIIKKSETRIARGDILVGIHIRRGDYTKPGIFTEFGYTTATEEYLQKATNYFRDHYRNPTFIVCSNDITWSRKALGRYSDVYFAEGNTPETDMALLTMTNHTIMTVGTFGWWSAFLTNGTTLYYKHPFVPDSAFSKQFNGDISEHFYPGWIGMD